MAAPASVSALPEPASSFSFIDTPLPANPLQVSYDSLFTPEQVTKNTAAAVEKYFAMGPCTIQEAEEAGAAKAKAEAAAKAKPKPQKQKQKSL